MALHTTPTNKKCFKNHKTHDGIANYKCRLFASTIDMKTCQTTTTTIISCGLYDMWMRCGFSLFSWYLAKQDTCVSERISKHDFSFGKSSWNYHCKILEAGYNSTGGRMDYEMLRSLLAIKLTFLKRAQDGSQLNIIWQAFKSCSTDATKWSTKI